MNECKVAIREKNLKTLHAICKKHNVTFWLMYGTLLGAYRDGELIPWDTDDDIGYFRKNKQVFANKIIPDLKKEGFRIGKHNTTWKIRRNSNYIDAFLMERKKDNYIHLCNSKWPRICFDVLNEIELAGLIFNIPSMTDIILRSNYGDDWAVPQKGVRYSPCNKNKLEPGQSKCEAWLAEAKNRIKK